MNAVIDASAAYGLFGSNDWDASIGRIDELIAPDLITAEILNARWKATERNAIAPSLDVIFDFLRRLFIVPSIEYARDAALLAEKLNHPVYDCIYASVARREGVRLLTADDRFSRKLRQHRFGALLA